MEAIKVLVVQFGTENTGTGAKGEWTKLEMIVKTTDQYPKTICVALWNATATYVKNNVKEGDVISVKLEISSREYNGRWYTEVSGRDITVVQGEPTVQAPAPQQNWDNYEGDNENDLPF